MHVLLEYPLSGGSRVGRALAGVDEADRERVARSGFAEIDLATKSRDVPAEVQPFLAALAGKLAGRVSVRAATEQETSAALERLRIPDPPPGLSPATLEIVRRLQARAAQVTTVFVARAGRRRPFTLALSPDKERVVSIE